MVIVTRRRWMAIVGSGDASSRFGIVASRYEGYSGKYVKQFINNNNNKS